MFAAMGLAAALAVTPAGASSTQEAAQAVKQQGGADSDFDAGLRAHQRGDFVEATRLFRLAADQGLAAAQHNLGAIYSEGQGVPQDDVEAVRWWQMAADRGFAVAQFSLGIMLANGRGVPKNDAEAVRWYRMAADHGNAEAQLNIGFMYDKGRGVPQNYVEAYKWWALAAAQGNAKAVTNIDYVRGQMSPAQIAEGQRLAAEWRPR